MAEEVKLVFTAETSDAVKGIKQVNTELKDNLPKAAKGSSLSLTDLKSGLDLATQAFRAVKGAAESVINPTVALAKQVRDLARDIGATPEEASRLIQAADDMNVSVGTLEAGLRAAIRKGIEPTIEGMGELSDQYLSIQDPIERTKFLMDTFGRSGAELGPLMEKGSAGIKELGDAAERAGLVMDEQAVTAARNYEIATDNLDDAILGLKISLAQELLPAINESINGITGQIEVNRLAKKAVDAGALSYEEFRQVQVKVTAGTLTTTEAIEILNAAMWKQDRAGLANTARWQGQADAFLAEVVPAVNSVTTAILLADDAEFKLARSANATNIALNEQRVKAENLAAGLLLSAGMSGTITSATETYLGIMEETTTEIGDLTEKLSHYNSLQGESVTVVDEATVSAAEYELAQINAGIAAQKLAEFTGDSRTELLELTIASANAQEKVVKLGEGLGFSRDVTLDYTAKIGETNASLEELYARQAAAEEVLKRTTAEFIFQKISAGLDERALLTLAGQMGLLDGASVIAGQAALDLRKEFDEGKLSAEQFGVKADELARIIASLQSREIEITVTTINREINLAAASAYAGQGEGTRFGEQGEDGLQFGGRARAGRPYMVGEAGPEMFMPQQSGFVMDNADTMRLIRALEGLSGGSTTINATYPQQSQSSVAQELRLMSALKG